MNVGSFYIYPPNAEDVGEEYVYELSEKEGKVWMKCISVYSYKVLFDGFINEFDAEKIKEN